MPLYEFDNFQGGVASGLWNEFTTNATFTYLTSGQSGLQMARVAVSPATGQTGIVRKVTRNFAQGDTAFFLFQIDLLSNADTEGSLWDVGFTLAGTGLPSGSEVGASYNNELNPLGPSVTGSTRGISTDLSPVGILLVGDLMTQQMICTNDANKFLDITIQGGVFVSPTFAAHPGLADATAYAFAPEMELAGTTMTLTAICYGWYDANGIAPPVPLTLSLDEADDTQIRFEWDPNGADGTNASNFEMQASVSPAFTSPLSAGTGTPTENNGTIGGLQPGTLYYLRVRSQVFLTTSKTTQTTYSSAWSDPITGTTTGNPPGGNSDGDMFIVDETFGAL